MPTSPIPILARRAALAGALLCPVLAAAQVLPLGPRVVVDWGNFPSLAVDPAGRFAVAWDRNTAITADDTGFLQMFDARGRPSGSRVRLVRRGPQREVFTSAAAAASPGSFLVAWVDRERFKNDADLFVRFFDPRGRPQGRALKLVGQQPDIQNYISGVAGNRQGDAVVLWTTLDIRSEPWRDFIRVRRFDSRNRPVGRVRTLRFAARPAELAGARVAVDERGRFVVAWDEKPSTGRDFRLFFQRYSRNGEKRGNKRLLSADRPYHFGAPVLAAEPTGEFVVVWLARVDDEPGEDRQREVRARWFDPFGRPLSDEVRVTEAGAFVLPAVGRDRFGNTVILWTDAPQSGPSQVAARVFDRLGQPLGQAVEIGAGIGGSVGFDDDGNFVVAWLWDDPAVRHRNFSAFRRFRLTCAPGYEQRCP